MSVETSNAQQRLWAVMRSNDGWPLTMDSDREVAERRAREWNAHRMGASPRYVVEFVRRDLVVPTADEARQIAERMSLEGFESYDAAAQVLRSALLSRIEGDNDDA